VIITINDKNAHLYNALFAKAYQELKSRNLLKIEENDEGRFLSLDDYFAHMADLLTINNTYMMLPLDESPFTINANTRSITAPKIVALQNDQIAEVLTFTIDRYFDYMDLNNATIYVQWTLPSGKEGATEIEMKDVFSEPGKIRFGWPLDEEITSEVGIVKYSVRFWNKGTIKENGADVEKVVYSFNTLSSSITISPSLQPEVNPELEINKPLTENLFKAAIRNSQITSGNAPIPVAPHFGQPGENLPVYASLSDNTLTLKAQAYVSDTGSITYEWYYTPAVTETITTDDGDEVTFVAGVEYPYSDYTDIDGNEKKGFNVYGGTAEYSHFEQADVSNGLVLGEQYYIQVETTPAAYEPYEVEEGEEVTYVAYNSALAPTDGTILYQKVTRYTVPVGTDAIIVDGKEVAKDDVKVTGKYCVRAENTIGRNTSNPTTSTVCHLISPDEVQYKTNLPLSKIIPTSGDTLRVSVNSQSNNAATVTYEWKKDVTSSDMSAATAISDATTHELDVTTPGWYQVEASTSLNRESKNAISSICKVTYAPALPTMSYTEAMEELIPEGATVPQISGETDDVELEVVTEFNIDDYAASLYTEQLIYKWTVKFVDSDAERVLTKNDVVSGIDENGIHNSKITIKPIGSDKKIYTCYVTNVLNGQSISSDEENSLLFFVF
jgi:hypothetical protein